MSKHTPAPWVPAANWPHGLSMVCQHDGSGWRPVADCLVSGDAAEANARLIAAAPELLEALKAVKYSLDCLMRETGRSHFKADISASEMARAAIAKATGE